MPLAALRQWLSLGKSLGKSLVCIKTTGGSAGLTIRCCLRSHLQTEARRSDLADCIKKKSASRRTEEVEALYELLVRR